MQFLDDSLLPENQQPLVIQAAPYGPGLLPGDSTDVPVTMAEQVQKAVDCWNAGATVLHVHVRDADGKGRKGERMTSVQQIEQLVRVSRELYREVATGEQAKAIYQIGTHYKSADETLAKIGWAPNRAPGELGVPLRLAA